MGRGTNQRSRTGDTRMTEAPQGRVPSRRPWHPPAPRHQVDPQGAADGRRPAADPICGRRSARGGDRAADLRHRPREIALVDYFDAAFELEATMRGEGQEPRSAAILAHRFRRAGLGPPAAAARPRPCRLVRAPCRRRRALRGPASRRSDGRHSPARSSRWSTPVQARRQHPRHRGSAGDRPPATA